MLGGEGSARSGRWGGRACRRRAAPRRSGRLARRPLRRERPPAWPEANDRRRIEPSRRPGSRPRSPTISSICGSSAACRRPPSGRTAATSPPSPPIPGRSRPAGYVGRTGHPLPVALGGRSRAGRPATALDQPAPAGGLDPRLLPVRLRRRADRDGPRGPDRPAPPVPPAARSARRRRDRTACSRQVGGSEPAPGSPDPRPGAARAAVRGRPADQRGAQPRSRGPVARGRLRAGDRQGQQGAPRAGRRGRARLARPATSMRSARPGWSGRVGTSRTSSSVAARSS